MWTPVYFIRYTEFPVHVEGVTIPNSDGSFDIYINSSLCEKKQAETIRHELQHIRADHFYDNLKPVEQIEACADKDRSLDDVEISAGFSPNLNVACM